MSAITEGGPTRCPKCNGRYISTPSTPLTPYTPVFKPQAPPPERAPPPFTSSRMAEPERPRYPPQMQPRIGSPRMTMPPQQMQHRRMQYPSQNMSTHHERDDEMEFSSPNPEQKRRRYNEAPRYSISSPTHYSQQQQAFGRPPPPQMSSSSNTYRQPQQPLLSGPNNMMTRPPPLNTSMGPPSQGTPRHPYPTRSTTTPSNTHNSFDESLRLPPLQTQLAHPISSSAHSQRTHSISSPSSTPHLANLSVKDSRARSVEAMVMTIPYTRKIKTLHHISPPLAAPGPSSPAQETRGPVIAIEGSDLALLHEVGAFIEETLRGDPSFCVRVWETLPTSSSQSSTEIEGDVEMIDQTPCSSKEKAKEKENPQLESPRGKDQFVEYLTLITNMHRTSHDISKHITTLPPPSLSNSNTNHNPNSQTQIQTPIALLPTGFSLTTSNLFAGKIPINDSYAPLDHWQWMATLWRGIIGPDLTVYVCKVGREEWGKFGGVEVRGDLEGCIVVRVLDEDGMRVEEKTRRRLGFEVLEFVRAGEGGWGRI